MVERNTCDGRDARLWYDVGSIKASADAGLETGKIDVRVTENEQRRKRGGLEEREFGPKREGSLDRVVEHVVGNGGAIDPDAFSKAA